jgi:hypothetical protein
LNLNDSKWRFPYRSNSLTFHFNNINPFNAEKDRFSVKLEGFDKSFREIGSDRKAVFTSLPAGKYSLIVRVNNLNTLQTQEKKLLQFKIRPPYWQSWWFYILIACALITLIFVFYREREKQLKRKAKADLETAELEMQALQAQMNPHFVFNVINSIQRYILERDAKNGTQLLGDFSRMIRQTFTLSSKKVITLQEEMAYLASYLKLEQERYANRFQFEFDLEQGLDPTKTHIPSMLIQPIVENGVKHGLSPLEGSSGMLSIRFSKINDQSLQCVIEDNGIGLEKSLAAKQDSSGHLSKALNITQRRIELFRKTSKANAYFVKVMDRSKLRIDQTGTIVSLIIPAQYS